MGNTRVYSRSFAGGELSPEMFGRIDDAKFQSGAAELENFLVTPTGAAKNRAGFAYVSATKNNGIARLISFTFSLNQTMAIELGLGYARFHTMGETLKYSTEQPAFLPSAQVTYTIASPTVITWAGHGLTSGQSVVLAILLTDEPTGAYPTGLGYGPYDVEVIDADSFHLIDAATGDLAAVTAAAEDSGLAVQPNHAIGDIVSHGGVFYYRLGVPPSLVPGSIYLDTNPATDEYWYLLPTDLTYEIPTPYATADLFSIHYAQSADVMTLVHPNYPPQELARLSATAWAMTPFSFAPPLATPQNVAVAASPGYLAQIESVTDGTVDGSGVSYVGQALITTVSSHTLALGDGVYVANLTYTPPSGPPVVLDGFYMVAAVPVDSSGNLINDELYLMDYSGNNLEWESTGSYSYGATIQYGTKIFNIVSPYAVQAFGSDGVSSSLLSASVSVLNNLDVPGSFNTISWAAVAGAANYSVYKQFNGLWGFIGTTPSLSFVDNNIAPDMSIVPGTPYGVFSGAGNYPGAVCYFQQRKCFAGTFNAPQNAWMSNSGTESMFSYSLPSLDTDAVVFRVAALQADTIQHLMPMLELILLTSESEYALVPVNSSAITPSSVSVNPQSYIGASGVQPTIINTSMVYAAARGGHVRELGYAWTVNGYMTNDLSLRAAHLFDNLTIVDQAYSKAPWPIVWFVSSGGDLLGLTYIPEEQLGAWHHHSTEGTFESIACVSEGAEDVLYAVVNRTINGQTVRYVERMATRQITTLSAGFFVDAGITQTFGAPKTQITGLTWLEGCTVAVLADGGVQSQKVVTGGAITLDHAASTVTVGLPYMSDLQTLPAVMQLDGYGQGRTKNINKAWVKVYQSSGILVGPDAEHLTEIAQRTNEPWGSPPSLKTAELLVLNTPSWQENGQVLIRQAQPLPLEVVGLTLEVAIGG
jgi:hypothetical protein